MRFEMRLLRLTGWYRGGCVERGLAGKRYAECASWCDLSQSFSFGLPGDDSVESLIRCLKGLGYARVVWTTHARRLMADVCVCVSVSSFSCGCWRSSPSDALL